MVVTVGINGFGRIGRVIFRSCLQNPNIQILALNDPAVSVEYICYLIKFDSTHGKFCGNITNSCNELFVNVDFRGGFMNPLTPFFGSPLRVTLYENHGLSSQPFNILTAAAQAYPEGVLVVGLHIASNTCVLRYFPLLGCGKPIKVFHYKQPSKIPWSSMGVQYVIEASGMFTNYDKASGHISGDGIKRVIVTAPSVDVPMILLGINSNELHPDVKVLSCASSTLYCLAPIIKILDESYGVVEGFITSIHAMTPSLKPLDGLCLRGKHWRDHRSIHQNIIPASTGACKALGKIMPQVKDKLNGLAFRVPIVNVSVLDLTIRLNKPTSLQEIIKNVEKNIKLQNIIRISCDETVSSDFVGETHSCILDANSSLQLKPNFYKLICWYENEYSYACRVIDTIFFSEEHESNTSVIYTVSGSISNPVKEHLGNDKEKRHNNCGNNEFIKTKTSQYNLSSPLINKTAFISKTDMITSDKVDSERQYEHNKIWNDDNQSINIRQNRSSFFQTCKSFAPKCTMHTSSFKAQDKLEKVKHEFSKLANITDNILKMSSLSKTKKVQSTSKPPLCDVVKDEGSINSPLLNTVRNCIKFNNGPAFDVSGDFHTSCDHINVKNCNVNNMIVPLHDIREINRKLIHNDNKDKKNILNTPINNTSDRENESIKTSHYLKRQVAKSFNIFFNDIQPNMQCPNSWNKLSKGISVHKPNNDDKSTQQDMRKNDLDSKMCSTENNMESKSDKIQFKTMENLDEIKLNEKLNKISLYKYPRYFENTYSRIEVLSEELRKRNIVISSHDSSDSYKTEPNKNKLKDIKLENKMDEFTNFHKETSVGISESPYRYPSPSYTNTTISNSDRRRANQDIYDKLDSTSASDSENSFQVHERKSQIINIQDLTSSLDDLVRLDKICRVIEISDDLSNELFSALDRNEDSLHENKWSFKDLCEKIKLDEFCDKVFGKSIL